MASLNNLQRNNNNKTSSSSGHGKLGFRQVFRGPRHVLLVDMPNRSQYYSTIPLMPLYSVLPGYTHSKLQ